jgi:hypothetical protein
MNEEDSEEEIEQIPISKTKRKRVDSEDEPDDLMMDDSVSDQSDDQVGDYDDEEGEEGGLVDVMESDDEVEGGHEMRRLEESSSADQEMAEYDDESSDQ